MAANSSGKTALSPSTQRLLNWEGVFSCHAVLLDHIKANKLGAALIYIVVVVIAVATDDTSEGI